MPRQNVFLAHMEVIRLGSAKVLPLGAKSSGLVREQALARFFGAEVRFEKA